VIGASVGASVALFGGVMFAVGVLVGRGLASGSDPATLVSPTSPTPVSRAAPTPVPRPATLAAARQPTPARQSAAPVSQAPTPIPLPNRTPLAAPAVPPPDCTPPCRLFEIVWTGDNMLGDSAQRYLDEFGYAWPFQHLRPLLQADYVVGNHEAPITERTEDAFPNAQWSYHIQPAAARALADAGFKAVGLSNNHVLDRGPEGLADTLRHLRDAGIRPFGAGMNRDEASAPLLISTPHGTIGVLALGQSWTQGAPAGPGQPGTIVLDDESIAQGAQAARAAGAKWLVGFVHWGSNYEPVTPRQRQWAASFARAGYNLVIGHHPHIVQEVQVIENMPVLYSIGNFVFGTGGRFNSKAPGFGLVARTGFGPSGLSSLQLSCVLTDNDDVRFQPRPCDEPQARTLMQSLGPRVVWQDSKGHVVP
jgi:hypothetical protein